MLTGSFAKNGRIVCRSKTIIKITPSLLNSMKAIISLEDKLITNGKLQSHPKRTPY